MVDNEYTGAKNAESTYRSRSMRTRNERKTRRTQKQIEGWTTRVLCPATKEFFEVNVEQMYLDALPGKVNLVYMTDCLKCDGKHQIQANEIPQTVRKYLLEQE